MKLQRNTLLALYSVLEFAAEPARRRSAAAIALKYGASVHHVAKVLGRLGGAGLLRASRGAGGGYRFVGNPKRVTLMDVIALFEDVGTGATRPRRRAEEKAVHAVLVEIDEIARATFQSITLKTMLGLSRRLAQRR